MVIDFSKERYTYIKHYALSKRPIQFTAEIHAVYSMGREGEWNIQGKANNEKKIDSEMGEIRTDIQT